VLSGSKGEAMSATLHPADVRFRALIDWLEMVDVPNPPASFHLVHRPRAVTATVQFIGGPVGTENFALKGEWVGTLSRSVVGGTAHRLLHGTLHSTLEAPQPGQTSGPLDFNLRIGDNTFFGGVSNPQGNPRLDRKWEEGQTVVVNADIDPLAPVVVASLEDFADGFGDQFLFSLGPNRTLSP
jgi:hypothetical protein